MEEIFVIGQTTSIEEKKNIEFKGVKELKNKDIFSEIVDFAKENINAFVNSEGGTLYIGIEDNGQVSGVSLNREERDDIQRRISQTIKNFYPPLEASAYKIDLLPIYSNTRETLFEKFVIKIKVTQGQEAVYWMSANKTIAYIRLNNEKQSMHPRMIEKRIKNGRDILIADNTNAGNFRRDSNHKFSTDWSREKDSGREIAIKRTSSVSFRYKLPLAFCNLDDEKEGEFIFSRYENIKFTVSRHFILHSLMYGLNTPLEWLSRPYLELIDLNLFNVTLEGAKITLSIEEVIDLCECVDEICGKYKQSIIDAESHLQTKNFYPLHVEKSFYGFNILSVKPAIWDLMYKFSFEFHESKGESEWHIFETRYESIHLSRNFSSHAILMPRRHNFFGNSANLEYIDIIYLADDLLLNRRLTSSNWKENLGEYGTWTAKKTRDWLVNKFIPKVTEYYKTTKIEMPYYPFVELPPLEKIQNGEQLANYVLKIQQWFPGKRRIPAIVATKYYFAFLSLLGNATVTDDILGYIFGKLNDLEEKIESRTLMSAFKIISQHAHQVKKEGFEDGYYADIISRVFIAVLENGRVVFEQYKLNQAIKSIEALIRDCMFEIRHCEDNYYHSG